MIKPFRGSFRISQVFGANPDMYSRFGYKGHNGIDFAIPTGTEVIAPHGGKIIEAAFDADGYGNYIKIENGIEGSVLAHNRELKVKVGDEVIEGQTIAISGSTGYSTGPHIHWGYYLLPRDRANGYGGFINQEGKYSDSLNDTYKGYNLSNMPKESIMALIDLQEAVNNGDFVRKEDLANIVKDLEALKKSQEDLAREVVTLRQNIEQKDESIEISTQEMLLLKAENQKLSADIEYYKPYKSRYEEALQKIPNSATGIELIIAGIKKLLNRK